MNLRNPVNPDDLAAVRQWFDTLSKHCRAVDYEGARPIFADDMIAFGTFTDFMIGRDLAEQKQWRNVCTSRRAPSFATCARKAPPTRPCSTRF